eukprot:5691256-Prymnesium_polylepis.2
MTPDTPPAAHERHDERIGGRSMSLDLGAAHAPRGRVCPALSVPPCHKCVKPAVARRGHGARAVAPDPHASASARAQTPVAEGEH